METISNFIQEKAKGQQAEQTPGSSSKGDEQQSMGGGDMTSYCR